MYLHLYHGRKDPNQDMDDDQQAHENGGWGTDGGQFNITALICTYKHHIRVVTKEYPDTIDLCFNGDCLYYDGVYYGDWSVSDTPNKDMEVGVLEEEKATIPVKETLITHP